MAKKRKPDKKRGATKNASAGKGQSRDPVIGRLFMEQLLSKFTATLEGGRGGTALDRAQELVYAAAETDDVEEVIGLAQQALAISPDCADAYTILAEHAPGPRRALPFYEQALAAGERALGKKAFAEDAGHFWGIIETRPYMRARLGLAQALWSTGRRADAVEHLQEMLRLNPNDNQGVRYLLAAHLLAQSRDDDLERLLDQFADDGMCSWAFTKVLAAYRRAGDSERLRKLLAEARKGNKHVVPYLLCQEPLPPEMPPHYSPGDKDEAALYVAEFAAGWRETPGAVTWLRQACRTPQRKKGPAAPAGPTAAVKQRIERLPQTLGMEWQAGVQRLPMWMEEEGEMLRPWQIVVANCSDEMIVAQEIVLQRPTADTLWDCLAQAMQRPLTGKPQRPSEIQVREDNEWEHIQPHLEEIGVDCIFRAELEDLDFLLREMRQMIVQESEFPALLEIEGVTPEQLGGFFAAAADYYRHAPWRHFDDETVVKVECDGIAGGPWYAVVMGQTGLTYGVAVYANLEGLRDLWQGRVAPDTARGEHMGMSVIFGEPFQLSPVDLEAAEERGWPVATPEAYPAAVRAEPGPTFRPPSSQDLEILEVCLRALPEFLTRHPRLETAVSETLTVPLASRELQARLTWSPGTDIA